MAKNVATATQNAEQSSQKHDEEMPDEIPVEIWGIPARYDTTGSLTRQATFQRIYIC